jgi:hypothetical protein
MERSEIYAMRLMNVGGKDKASSSVMQSTLSTPSMVSPDMGRGLELPSPGDVDTPSWF